jgi:hypothetical protein
MKLVYFDDYKLGVVKGDRVVDVSRPCAIFRRLPWRFDQRPDRALRAVSREARGRGGERPRCPGLLGPSARPAKSGPIDAMAVNYMDTAPAGAR